MVNVADLDLLRQVAERSDEMVVGVLADELVRTIHGRSAVVPADERIELVRSLRQTTEVILVRGPGDIPRDVELYTDEPALAEHFDVLLTPERTSSSPELVAALASVGGVAR